LRSLINTFEILSPTERNSNVSTLNLITSPHVTRTSHYGTEAGNKTSVRCTIKRFFAQNHGRTNDVITQNPLRGTTAGPRKQCGSAGLGKQCGLPEHFCMKLDVPYEFRAGCSVSLRKNPNVCIQEQTCNHSRPRQLQQHWTYRHYYLLILSVRMPTVSLLTSISRNVTQTAPLAFSNRDVCNTGK